MYIIVTENRTFDDPTNSCHQMTILVQLTSPRTDIASRTRSPSLREKTLEIGKMFKLVCVSIVTICLQLTSGGVMKPDDSIKYPGPIKNRNGIPDECKDQNFCTIKPADYPQEQFDQMFKGSRFGKLPNLVLNDTVEFPNRQGGPGDEDDCRTTVTYEPLYKVRTKRGDWRTVVQAEQENYVQKVRLETCLKPQSKCFTRFGEIPGIETYCRQNYNDWEIVVSDGKGGTETVTTSLPVCCSCHYRSIDLASRFGPKETRALIGG